MLLHRIAFGHRVGHLGLGRRQLLHVVEFAAQDLELRAIRIGQQLVSRHRHLALAAGLLGALALRLLVLVEVHDVVVAAARVGHLKRTVERDVGKKWLGLGIHSGFTRR